MGMDDPLFPRRGDVGDAGLAVGLEARHWYLFAQPFDLPERLLRADPA